MAGKRLVICCDGTWNTPDQMDRGQVRPSNAVRMARSIVATDAVGITQIAFYDRGVGTDWGLDRFTGGSRRWLDRQGASRETSRHTFSSPKRAWLMTIDKYQFADYSACAA